MPLILYGTDSNVSIPAIQGGTGGATTGIYYPAANTIAIVTSGANAITANSTRAVSFSNNVSISGTASVAGDLSFNSGYGSSAIAYGCRAWVNFNGTGTVAIRTSGNVTSITDNGTGDYTVNFTSTMPDANLCASGFVRVSGSAGFLGGTNDTVFTTSSARIGTYSSGASTNADALFVCIAIFR